MPFLEYECEDGHRQELFFKSISEGEHTPSIMCDTCNKVAHKIFSVPLGFGLYGDPAGYSKPSATKRFSTKTISKRNGNKL